MAKKQNLEKDEKFEKQELNLFELLTILDNKNTNFYDSLSDEQKKKFVPYMTIHWMSCVKSSKELMSYYLLSANEHANKYLFNENIQKHPKLQYLMMTSISPGLGKQFHQWIPTITPNVTKLKQTAKVKDIKEYFTKLYPNTDGNSLQELSEAFVENQKRKVYLAELMPNLKIEDIETLNEIITDEDIVQYEKDRGN